MTLSVWRDISIVWLSLFCLIGLAIPLVALYFAVLGLNSLHQKTAGALRQGQIYSRQLRQQGDHLSRSVAEPVIRTSGKASRWRTVVERLWNNRAT